MNHAGGAPFKITKHITCQSIYQCFIGFGHRRGLVDCTASIKMLCVTVEIKFASYLICVKAPLCLDLEKHNRTFKSLVFGQNVGSTSLKSSFFFSGSQFSFILRAINLPRSMLPPNK